MMCGQVYRLLSLCIGFDAGEVPFDRVRFGQADAVLQHE
jgi:hypothetical protein